MNDSRFPTGRDEKRAALLEAVASVRSTIEAGVEEAERIATLPAATVAALRDAGLFRLKLPAELGGAEADPVTQIEVLEALSYIDASAGWCTMIGATGVALPGAFLPPPAVEVVFKDGHVPTAAGVVVPNGKALPVDGGYRLSGRWQFGSGVRHADWLSAGALVPGPGGKAPERRSFVFPASSAQIHDNWQVAGLKGTGSCDFSVEDILVPEEFTFPTSAFRSGLPQRGGALYRLGSPAFVANEHAAFALGVAKRALHELIEVATQKRRGPGVLMSDRAVVQAAVGEIDVRLRSARAHVLDVFEAAWQIVCAGESLTSRQQEETRAAAVFVTAVAAEITTRAFRLAGGSALHEEDVLQRCLRDINAGAQHYMVSEDAYELLGRFVLGLPDAQVTP